MSNNHSHNKTHYDDIKNTIAYRHGAQSPEELAQKSKHIESSSNLHSEFDELTKEAAEKFEHYKKTGKLLSHHASGIAKLAKTEAQLTASAYTKIVKLSAILVPIAFVLYISICISIGMLAYSLTQSIAISTGLFLAFQLAVCSIIILSIKSAKSYTGFNKTKQQIKGLKNELAHLF